MYIIIIIIIISSSSSSVINIINIIIIFGHRKILHTLTAVNGLALAAALLFLNAVSLLENG